MTGEYAANLRRAQLKAMELSGTVQAGPITWIELHELGFRVRSKWGEVQHEKIVSFEDVEWFALNALEKAVEDNHRACSVPVWRKKRDRT